MNTLNEYGGCINDLSFIIYVLEATLDIVTCDAELNETEVLSSGKISLTYVLLTF